MKAYKLIDRIDEETGRSIFAYGQAETIYHLGRVNRPRLYFAIRGYFLTAFATRLDAEAFIFENTPFAKDQPELWEVSGIKRKIKPRKKLDLLADYDIDNVPGYSDWPPGTVFLDKVKFIRLIKKYY